MNKELVSKYLRAMADSADAGKLGGIAIATLEKCDDCPDMHAHVYVSVDYEQSVNNGLFLVGSTSMLVDAVKSNVQGESMRVAIKEAREHAAVAMAQAEAAGASKQ